MEPSQAGFRIDIFLGALIEESIALGDSIASNGVCLTAVERSRDGFVADVSRETLDCTTLGQWKVGVSVNLELAMTPTSRLGGHLVSGHVDGVGSVVRRYRDGLSERFVLRAPPGLSRYIATKGSICIDGVSLTVNGVEGDEFHVNIVPHTLSHTIMGGYRANTPVNLEVDVIARYLERLLDARGTGAGVTVEQLVQAGFGGAR